MAYACPVCSEVHADEEHLANHLAVTASLHGDGHDAWLDEHVPDWPNCSPADLGEEVVEHADPQSVEGALESHDHDNPAPGGSFESALGRQNGAGRTQDHETERVLREARELTKRMAVAKSGGGDDDTGAGSPDDGKQGGDG